MVERYDMALVVDLPIHGSHKVFHHHFEVGCHCSINATVYRYEIPLLGKGNTQQIHLLLGKIQLCSGLRIGKNGVGRSEQP